MWDYFISYASEDRERIVRPLVSVLTNIGLRVWYDRFELKAGDSLFGRIQEGIASARHGIVVISATFLQKKWPQAEIAAMFAAEGIGSRRILPVWHGLSPHELSKQAPILADRIGISSDQGLLNVAAEILRATAPEKLPQLRVLGLTDAFGSSERLRFAREGWNAAHIPEEWTQEGREVASALLNAGGIRDDFATLLSAYPTLLLDAFNVRYGRLDLRSELQTRFSIESKFEFMLTPMTPWPTTGPWGHMLVYLGPTKVEGSKARLALAGDIVDADRSELASIVAATRLRYSDRSSTRGNSEVRVIGTRYQKPSFSDLFRPAKCQWVSVHVILGRRSEPPGYPHEDMGDKRHPLANTVESGVDCPVELVSYDRLTGPLT